LTEYQENFSTTDSKTQKSKKFVFRLYSDNIDFVETLSYQEKNDLVNQLLDDYRGAAIYNKKVTKNISLTKKAVIIFLAIVVGIPLLIYLTSLSLDLTKSSYTEMQKNFEKLF
jgi:hypothetical protein